MAGEHKQERNSLKTRKNLFDKSTMLCFIASVNKYKLTHCSLNNVLYEQNDEVLKTYKTTLFPLFDLTFQHCNLRLCP